MSELLAVTREWVSVAGDIGRFTSSVMRHVYGLRVLRFFGETLRQAGMEDAAAALATLPEQMDGKAVEKFCTVYGLTLESLADRMGGSP